MIMNSKILLFAVGLLTLTCFCSCDEHEHVDLDIHVGDILCSDGRIVRSSVFDSSKEKAVGVVFAEQDDKHPVLAVMLDEVKNIAFADTLSFDQKTSCSVDSCDGFTNTVALETTYLPGMRQHRVWRDSVYVNEYYQDPHYYGSPLGLYSFYHHYFGQSDFVPSVMELQLLYKSLGTVNPIIQMLGGTPIGTQANKDAGCWYWSSTEVEGNSMNQAWLVSMADGSQHKAPKINFYRARLIVEYNPYRIK